MASSAALSRPWRISFDRPDQIKAGLIGIAFIALFWELLDFVPPSYGLLVWTWLNQSDWSHGPIIPLFSAYLVYVKWDAIRATPVRYGWVGLPILFGSLMLYFGSLVGFVNFGYAKYVAMMGALLGVIIAVCGLPVMRHAWAPWLYLMFAIPLPQRIYFELTNPLRRIAAEVAVTVLSLIPSLEIERVGSNIFAIYQNVQHQLGVADACSGMRSTITLCALGVAVAFIFERPWWQRLVMIASCLPIAVACNFLRVLITCWLHIFVDERYATGMYHTMLGLVMLGLAFGLFSLLSWALTQLVVEEEDDSEAAPGSAS